MSRKNDPERGITQESAHKALQSAIGGRDGRASEKATKVAVKRTEHFLMMLGKDARELVMLKDVKTVNEPILNRALALAIVARPCNLRAADIDAWRPRIVPGAKGIIKKGAAERVFRRGAGDLRTTDEVKLQLAAAANAYLAALAHKAAMFANAAKRKTIKPSDVIAAASVLA